MLICQRRRLERVTASQRHSLRRQKRSPTNFSKIEVLLHLHGCLWSSADILMSGGVLALLLLQTHITPSPFCGSAATLRFHVWLPVCDSAWKSNNANGRCPPARSDQAFVVSQLKQVDILLSVGLKQHEIQIFMQPSEAEARFWQQYGVLNRPVPVAQVKHDYCSCCL